MPRQRLQVPIFWYPLRPESWDGGTQAGDTQPPVWGMAVDEAQRSVFGQTWVPPKFSSDNFVQFQQQLWPSAG